MYLHSIGLTTGDLLMQNPAMLFSRFRSINTALHLEYLGRRNYSPSNRSLTGSSTSIQVRKLLQTLHWHFFSPYKQHSETQRPRSTSNPAHKDRRQQTRHRVLPQALIPLVGWSHQWIRRFWPWPVHRRYCTQKLLDLGYDPTSFWEQKITWGFHDVFIQISNANTANGCKSSNCRQVNNVH